MPEPGAYAMPTPAHPTGWRSHLKIAHCVIIPGGKQGDACDFEALHDELHAHPLQGAITHRHTPPTPPDPNGHGFW